MNSKADEWLDFLQGQGQFWPTMTTHHASLAPIVSGGQCSRNIYGTSYALIGTSCTLPPRLGVFFVPMLLTVRPPFSQWRCLEWLDMSMNTLYVWFSASWGPSVGPISKRNQKWLQQHPVHRDSALFNPLELKMDLRPGR